MIPDTEELIQCIFLSAPIVRMDIGDLDDINPHTQELVLLTIFGKYQILV